MLSEQTVPRNVCRMCCSAVEHLPADGKVVVPALWKTTCLVPVPKKQASKDSVTTDKALTSPAMKALEMLVLKYLWSLVGPSLDLLQFAYPSCIGVEDAIIYPLQRHIQTPDKAGSTVRVPSFSSAVANIRPAPGWGPPWSLQGTALSLFLRWTSDTAQGPTTSRPFGTTRPSWAVSEDVKPSTESSIESESLMKELVVDLRRKQPQKGLWWRPLQTPGASWRQWTRLNIEHICRCFIPQWSSVIVYAVVCWSSG